jgi:type II secretory pathway pseudopilin PulG
MHFHLPKPLHGWREFAGEVGIIVVGVLIALGAEQLMELVHDRSKANQARANVRAEAALDVDFLNGRLAYQNCIERRLDELSNILSEAGDGPLKRQPTWISRPPTGPFFTRRWEAATASGRNSLFAEDEQERFGMLYDIFARFNEYQGREQQVWSDLRALENWQGPLGPEARLSFAKDLQQAKYLAWDLSYAGRKAMEVASASGLVPPSSADDKVAICLPIFTPRDVALRQLAGPYGQP